MKKRSTVIALFLLVAVLVMGIGYAAITRQFTVTGNAAFGVNVANFPVKIENTKVVSASNTTTENLQNAIVFTTGNDGITLTAGIQAGVLVKANEGNEDTVVFSFDVVNYSEHYKAQMSDIALTSDSSSYLNVTTSGMSSSTLLEASGAADNADRCTVTVTVKLDDLPNDDQTLTFTLRFTATSVED